MGSTDFDEFMECKREALRAQERAASLEKQLRAVIKFGTRGNCPPGSHCRRGVTGNCEACWLAFAGLSALPQGVERERETSEEQIDE